MMPDLSVYYYVEADEDRLDQIADRLRGHDEVAGAYVKPPGEAPVMVEDETVILNDMQPRAEDAPPATPDFTSRQGYLEAAPGGIEARFAWTQPGGRGAGVRIIDCEWGWRFTHEDLGVNQGGVIAGTNSTDSNHGTAVLGEFSGDRNTVGITGICPDANVRAVAFSMPTATAIRTAADSLGPGDIILLEIHRPAQRHRIGPVWVHRRRMVAGRLRRDPVRCQ